ncbi:MAG: tetratricopeptide repeat protein, partial [Eubacteriales bacterium]|nr:tetratricopeptide repeat protein [Eubacteriales bacterium]
LHQKMPGSRIYHTLGYAYILAGKLERALEYNKEAMDYDDEDFVILDNLGQTYYEMGDMPNAKLYFEKAYEQKQEQIDILYHLGLVYEADGDLPRALKLYRQALLYQPDSLNDVTRTQLFDCEKRVIDSILARGDAVPEPEVEIKRDDQTEDL